MTCGTATQRCQLPSGWTGPSHLLMTCPPYWQPALAGVAEGISPAAVSRATDAPMMQRFMDASRHFATLGRCRVFGQPMRLPLVRLLFAAFEVVIHGR